MACRNLSRDSYRVGWICPLEVEQIAAMEMLDEEHQPLPQPSGDTNVYNLGSINGHNVVIAGLPRVGNCSAATVVTQMKMTFPNTKYGLLVGIGGGVPVETEHGMIRLGHVVVSEPTGTHSGAIQYDHGKAKMGQFERKGFLPPPPTVLLNAAREVAVRRQRMDYDPVWKNLERIRVDRQIHRRFKFPGAANDHLYTADYEHRQEGVSCEDGGCNGNYRIKRLVSEEYNPVVVVHRGTVASGEMVVKDARKRDKLAKQHGVLCFEMEAVGVLTDFPFMVIRGISDYCDSHKNDVWHGYAAAVAAAYARELFFHMSIEEPQLWVSQCYNVQWKQGYVHNLLMHLFRNPNPALITFELPFNLSATSAVNQFVAREDELAKLQEVLTGPVGRRTAVVQGLGGIGKTQLVLAHIKRHRSGYSAAIWMNASDEITLKQSFAQTAEWIQSHCPSITYMAGALESQDLDETVKAVKRWLNEPMNDRWLVVYDNYDNPLLRNFKRKTPSHASYIEATSCGDESEDLAKAFDLRTFLPETDHGAIIVTTRSSMVKLGQTVRLSKLQDINDSLKLLESVSSRGGLNQDPAAIDLAKELDGLPLALATAGAYLEQVSISYTEYLQLYRESWRQLHEATPQLPTYDQTLFSTWDVSYQYIRQQSSVAAMLLHQWAYFAKEDLWYELLEGAGPQKPEWLRELMKDKLTFHATMRLLCSHGLVEANPPMRSHTTESGGYSVHACVHSWMLYVLNQGVDNGMAWTAIKCVAARVPERSKREYWIIQRRLIAHADRCLKTFGETEVGGEIARALYSFSLLYLYQGRLREAEAICKRALAGDENLWGPDDIWTLSLVNNLGNIYENQGRPQEAESMYKRALEGYEKVWGGDSPLVLDIVNNLGVLYTNQGLLQEAEEMYERALQGNHKAWEQDDTSILDTVNNLGTLYASQGRFQDAEAMYQQALEGYEKACGREHTSTLVAVNNLGNLYTTQGRLQEAEAMHERALEGREKAWGREHTSTLESVNNLGLLYMEQGRLQEAEAMYTRALEGKEVTLGLEHTSTLATINNIGLLCVHQGRFQHAEAMYKRALEGYEKASGTSILTYIPALDTIENLGILCEKQGDIDNAILYYQRARAGTETVFGRNSARYAQLSTRIRSLQCESREIRETSGQEIIQSEQTPLEKKWRSFRAKLSHRFRS
ncbi:hypothetical protein N7457_008699 [Penicillium paradoxum]|uniref:uncharacterized protein n=1 Tax=Penicillium paradoxum TaxID=176176 RepID=UPI00254743D1|nr:uncharacterized protein N7457_008699 [Penicillium paradoxum]KAJ5773803.1 hypothetical protein N7457_008699 [Penicillium paradoxum]